MRNPFQRIRERFTKRRSRDVIPTTPPRPRRSVRDAITDAFGPDAYEKARSPRTQMAVALAAKPVYQGTVAKAVIQRRRAANKRARAARRVHRMARS